MLTTCPTTPAHIAVMELRVPVTLAAVHLTHAVTVLSEGEPLCCFGITPLWPGVGYAWFLERQPLAGHPYAARMARAVRQAWRRFTPDFRYIEALVVEGREDSRRLAEWLGLVPVARKPGYGPGGETMVEYQWRGRDGTGSRELGGDCGVGTLDRDDNGESGQGRARNDEGATTSETTRAACPGPTAALATASQRDGSRRSGRYRTAEAAGAVWDSTDHSDLAAGQ